MNLREIETKQEVIDFVLSLRRKWGFFTQEEDLVIAELDSIYCYDEFGWRSMDPAADDISDTQLNYVLLLIASLPDEQSVSYAAHIAA